MKNKKGFYLTNIIIKISIFLLIVNIGFVHIRNQNEKKEIKTAKTLIYENFHTYATKAFYKRQKYYIDIDYLKKEFSISEQIHRKGEVIKLPKNLKYVTIFNKKTQEQFQAKITINGNITPSFSIYIFGYDDIAKYRISFYGFDLIKYMKINIYKNRGDRSAKYSNILSFHRKWDIDNPLWVEE